MEPPNYTQQLLLQLNQQRSKGYLCDVIIVVENALFRAHKNVLAACSSYFKYLVLHENLITLNTEMVNPSVFNQVLDFIYTGQLPSSSHFSDQGMSELLRAASYLQLSDLAAVCRLKLKSSESKTWPSSAASSFSNKYQQVSTTYDQDESLEDGKTQRRGDVSEEEVFRKSGSTSSSSSSSSSDDLLLNSTSAFSNPALEQWYPMIDWQTAAQKRPGHGGEDCLEGSVQTKGKEVEHEGLIQAELEEQEEGLALKRESGTEDEEVKGNKYSGYVYQQQLQSAAYDSSYLCIPCGKGFTSSEQLIAHVDSHKTEDPEQERLLRMQDQYPESLASRSSKEEPAAEPRFSCSVCGKIYLDAAVLNHHERSHSLTRPFSCDVCGKLFTQRGTMTRHMRSHLGVKPFACEECGMRFTRQYRKMEHMRIHSREKPYQCQLCGARFTHQRSVISHLKMHAMVS